MGNLRALVEGALPARMPGARIAADSDELILPMPGGRARVALAPLLQRCLDEPRQIWPDLVTEWLAAVRSQLPDEVSAELGPADLEQLRLRLTPATATTSPDFMTIPYGEHFTAVLVLNRPDRLDVVTVAQVAQLGQDLEDLVRIAARQTVQHELLALDVRDHDLPSGGAVRLLASDGNPFVTTALMSLKRFLPEGSDNGALVAAPQYSAVMVYPVRAQVPEQAVALHNLTRSMFAAASDPCTEDIFWWYDGEFQPVRILTDPADGTVQVRVSESMAPVVARLGGPH